MNIRKQKLREEAIKEQPIDKLFKEIDFSFPIFPRRKGNYHSDRILRQYQEYNIVCLLISRKIFISYKEPEFDVLIDNQI